MGLMAGGRDRRVGHFVVLGVGYLVGPVLVLLLPCLVLPPADACLLDCELALGFALLLLALLFARPLDLVLALALDLTLVLDMELDFLMTVQKTMIIMCFGSDMSLG